MTEAVTRRVRVFSASWGQLESAGSNMGDLAVFAAQAGQLLPGFDLGVMSGDPVRTRTEWGCTPFGVRRGRLAAMLRGVLWSDIVVVGGGELVQDSSSLLYTPFNLLPLELARIAGRPSFGWLVGIGQRGELRPWTPGATRRGLGSARGVSVRDADSATTLMDLGLNPVRLLRAADSAFCLARGDVRHSPEDVLGAAPRDVSNRTGRLLPLETRRRLGLAAKAPDEATARGWSELLDRHVERTGAGVVILPFHTGPLSNSDDAMCDAVLSRMRHAGSARVARPGSLGEFMDEISRCRIMLTTPLHGAILSVVAGVPPVSLPYSSKGRRFMREVGLEDLCTELGRPGWVEEAGALLDRAWRDSGSLAAGMAPARDDLVRLALANTAFFRSCCPGGD